MTPRRMCWPNCKVPEKRDFMDINPEKSAEDFYRNYDPVVGIETMGILLMFILLISIKSIMRCTVRKYKHWKYERKLKELRAVRQAARPSKEAVTFAPDDAQYVQELTNNNRA